MSYEVHFIAEFVLNGSMLAALAGREQQVVARFERVIRMDDLPQPGVTFRGVAFHDFCPSELIYDVENDKYIVQGRWPVCGAKGDCACQCEITGYLKDERWRMMSMDPTPTESKQEDGDG